MTGKLTLTSLPTTQRRLVALMQQINFGRLEGFSVRHGKPVLNCPPRIVREIRCQARQAQTAVTETDWDEIDTKLDEE